MTEREDVERFRVLFERQHARVFRFVFSMVGSRETAKELTQETFVRAYRSFGAFEGRSADSTWLCGIARNVVLNHVRATRQIRSRLLSVKPFRRPRYSLPNCVSEGAAMLRFIPITLAVVLTATTSRAATPLRAHGSVDAALRAGETHVYELTLRRGESAAIVAHQRGIDVVVEIRSPHGQRLDVVDGPTGRTGDEHIEILARESGRHSLIVRAFDDREPDGRYQIEVVAMRDAAATRTLLNARRQARAEATAWLARHSVSLDEIAAGARVIGLGEATHGSRELADARLALTRQLIENHGYRIVAIEASASGLAAPTFRESGWIGRRALRELMAWVGAWNDIHRDDPVRMLGLDAQNNQASRETLDAFLRRAYDDALLARWTDARNELAAADEQTAVFGDSGVQPAVRQFLFELCTRLALDAPVLRARFGASADDAIAAALNLAAFADFNSGAEGSRSRDWSMASKLAAALESAGPAARAVYWAHNAHVTTRGQTAGAILRSFLGCRYRSIAITFGEGSFVAQIPNDPEDRLAVSTLPPAVDDSIESVLAPRSHDRGPLTAWNCGASELAPPWLRAEHPMHWVGALWSPESVASAGSRPFDLLRDFDGVVYLPRVSAEEIPADRVRVAPRVR